jgi:LuxR family maltose regulon positive regulatory protein
VSQRNLVKRAPTQDRVGLLPDLPFEITEAKLQPPPIRPGMVPRPEVVDRLRASRQASVVAVSAPAGYGKTSLLVEWAEHERRPFAWVTIDDADNDPLVLLAHVAVALHRVEPVPDAVIAGLRARGASIPGTASRRGAFGEWTAGRLVLDDVDRLTDPTSTPSRSWRHTHRRGHSSHSRADRCERCRCRGSDPMAGSSRSASVSWRSMPSALTNS